MKIRHLVIFVTLLLLFSISACDLPEVTPPATEVIPSATPIISVQPLETPIVLSETIIPNPINAGNVASLILAQKAAVSNIQKVVWASDSQSLTLITQNPDSGGNQIYGVTSLLASDLSTQSVFTSQDQRIVAIAADGHTVAVLNNDLTSFSLVDTGNNNSVITTITPGYLIGYISFSPDLRYIAVTKMESWEVILYDFRDFLEVRVLSGFETAAPVFDARFDQSPQWLVWHARATIQLQEVETGTMGNTFSHEEFVSFYTLSPDGTILASSAAKMVNNDFAPVISLWDTSSGAEIRTLELTDMANAVAFSPDGKMLAAAVGSDLQLWDPAAGTLLTTLTGHSDMITQVVFSPDQKMIATSGIDNQLYLWQTNQ